MLPGDIDTDKPFCLLGVPVAGSAIAAWMVAAQHPVRSRVVLVENVRTTGASEEEALKRLAEDEISLRKVSCV